MNVSASSVPSFDRNARFMRAVRAGDLAGDRDRGRLPVETGELYTASDQTSGTLVDELRVLLWDCRAVVVGMMNQWGRAEWPNDKLQGVVVRSRFKRIK